MIPQMGYKNMLPLNKYAAEMLASDSVSPNRRSKIFLNRRSLSPEGTCTERRYLRGKVDEGVPERTAKNVQGNISVRDGRDFVSIIAA